MARKDVLKGLMGAPETKSAVPAPAPTAPKRPAYAKGAVGAVSRSISDLKARAIVEVPADMIDDTGGLRDRLGPLPEDDAALRDSIQTYGQQVPVLLRLDPNNEGRYQVVYGRRRVAALKALKLPVKALLRDLDDRDLILAQGQENSARRDLTFIEKANFARQMRDAGFDRKLICDALSIDKTLISRMLTVADSMGQKLIEAIGPAPGIGRDRWLRLVAALEATGTAPATLLKIVKGSDGPSDARFEAALTGAQTVSPPAPPPEKQSLTGENGAKLGTITRKPRAVALTVTDTEFGDWLTDNMTEVHRIFLQAKGGNGRD